MSPSEISEILGPFQGIPRYNQIRKLADSVLKENFVTEPPVRVDGLVQNYGLNIFRSDLETYSGPDGTTLSGVAGVISVHEKVIVVNKRSASNRQIFTVAHEFGHFLMHISELEKDPKYAILTSRPLGEANEDPIESEANYFAGCLLVPPRWLSQLDNYSKDDLAKLFAVSTEVIGYRMMDEKRRLKG